MGSRNLTAQNSRAAKPRQRRFQIRAYQQQVLLQNQQAINAMNQPRMTNCQYVGTMLNCTTF